MHTGDRYHRRKKLFTWLPGNACQLIFNVAIVSGMFQAHVDGKNHRPSPGQEKRGWSYSSRKIAGVVSMTPDLPFQSGSAPPRDYWLTASPHALYPKCTARS